MNVSNVSMLDWACYVLLIVGALNWGIVGLADVNVLELAVEPVFQPEAAEVVVRILYVLVGLAGLYFFYPLYRITQRADRRSTPGT